MYSSFWTANILYIAKFHKIKWWHGNILKLLLILLRGTEWLSTLIDVFNPSIYAVEAETTLLSEFSLEYTKSLKAAMAT